MGDGKGRAKSDSWGDYVCKATCNAAACITQEDFQGHLKKSNSHSKELSPFMVECISCMILFVDTNVDE
ncbi:hypothetical protein Ancab_027629, partial [Ancistrocladus abbreviatus]